MNELKDTVFLKHIAQKEIFLKKISRFEYIEYQRIRIGFDEQYTRLLSFEVNLWFCCRQKKKE